MEPRHTTVELTAAAVRDGVLRTGAWWTSDGEHAVELEVIGGGGMRRVSAVPRDGLFRGRPLATAYAAAGLAAEDRLLVRRTGKRSVRVSPLGPPFRFIDLFAGIGGFRLGFEAAGGTCVFSSEIDERACDSYEAHFGDRPHGDITKIDAAEVPAHDMLLAGFPCQPFSIIGRRRGFEDTRGTLFFDVARLVAHHRPAAVVLENVKQFRTHDGGRTCATVVRTLRDLGYAVDVAVLNALDYGVAQTRQRTIIVAVRDGSPGDNSAGAGAFRWPDPYPERADLADVLEPDGDVPEKLWASDYIREKRLARLAEQGCAPERPTVWHENKGGHIGMHPYSCAMRANASYNYLLVNGERRPTGREMLRLQGFPDDFKIVVPHAALRKQCGNAVAVPVVTEVAAAVALARRGEPGPSSLSKSPLPGSRRGRQSRNGTKHDSGSSQKGDEEPHGAQRRLRAL